MQVKALDHVNIRTRDLAASAKFYTDVLGLEARDPPTAYPGEVAKWMHDPSGRAVIHLRTYDAEPGSTGIIDHIAFDCADKPSLMMRVRDLGLEVMERAGDGWSVVFVRDPHGVMLELYFNE